MIKFIAFVKLLDGKIPMNKYNKLIVKKKLIPIKNERIDTSNRSGQKVSSANILEQTK